MDRYRVIEKLAKGNDWKQGLELGVWVGVTTFWLMQNTQLNMPNQPAYNPNIKQIQLNNQRKHLNQTEIVAQQI